MVPDTGVVCIDNLWQLTSSLPNGTIVNPVGLSLPSKLV